MKAQVWTVPNGLSALRLLLVPTAAWLLVQGNADSLAVALLVVSGITDWLDGFLARKLDQVSRLGALLDPLADRLAVICFATALAWRGAFTWWAVGIILLRDIALAATLPRLRKVGQWAVPVTRTGKAATAILFTALPLGLISLLSAGNTVLKLSAHTLLWIGAAVYWLAGIGYLRTVGSLSTAPLTNPSAQAGHDAPN